MCAFSQLKISHTTTNVGKPYKAITIARSFDKLRAGYTAYADFASMK